MANRYWVGGTGTWNSSSTTNWSATDGGGSGASVPTAADSVFFTNLSGLSGATITLTGTINCLGFTYSSTTSCTISSATFTLSCLASFIISNSSVNFSATGTIASTGSAVRGFNVACSIPNTNVNFLTGGTVTIGNNIICINTTIAVPTDFNGYYISASSSATVSVTSSNLTSIDLRSGSVQIAPTGTFTFSSGTIRTNNLSITSSTSFVYSDPATLIGFDGSSPLTTFTQAPGAAFSVTLNKALTLSSTGTYTLTSGSLNLNGTLTTGQFVSSGGVARAINFSTYNIVLNHTTAGTVVMSMADTRLLTYTGTGSFTTTMSVTRTFTVGTTNNSGITSAPFLSITSGTAVPTFTNNSFFNVLDFTGSSVTSTSATTVIVSSLILSTGGTFTNLNVQTEGTGSITTNGKTISDFSVGGATTTLNGSVTCASGIFYAGGSLDCSGYNITCSGSFSYRGTVLTNIGTITCTTWQIQTVTFNFTQGTINPSVSVVVTSGGFNYSGGTLGAVPLFTHTAGTVTLGNSYTLTAAGTYTFSGGQLNLANYTLTTGIFNAGGAGTARTIDFSTSSLLEITGNNATVLNLNSVTSYTGTVKIACTYVGSVGTRTISIGAWSQATVGTAAFDLKCSSCVGIQIYGGATDIIAVDGTLLNLDLTGMNFTFTQVGMIIYGDYTIPATGGSVTATSSTTTFASTNATARTITISRSIDFQITFNGVGGTFQLGANLTVTGLTRIMSLLNGTLSLNGYDLTVGYFSSNNSNTRAINFGANSITINGNVTPWDTTVTTGLTLTGSRTVNVVTAGVGTISVISGTSTETNSFDFNFSGTTTVNFLQNAGLAARNVNFTGFTGTLNATNAVTIYGSYTLSSGMTVTASSSIMTFGATSGTNIITTNGKTMPPITINGLGGTFNLGSTLTSSGVLQILAGTFDTTASNYAITCTSIDSALSTSVRAISFNDSIVTITGTAGVTLNDVNLTFSCGTSQLTLSNATSTVLSVIGSETFSDVSFTGGAPLVTIVGTNTYNNLTFTNGSTVPSIVTITGNQTVGGTLSNTSTNATTRLQLQSSISGTQIILSAGAESLNDVDFKDIDADGAAIPFTGTRLGNLGNNTDITFDAGVSKYWNLAAGGNWSAVAWATTSGGTPDVNNFPLAQDTCIIENTGLNTSATITINANWTFGTLNMSTRTNAMTLAIGTTSPIVTGNWTNGSGTTLTGTGTVNFKNTGTTQTITSSGITFTPNINYDSAGGTLQLATALTLGATSTFTLTKGVLSLNGFTLTTGTFSSNNGFTRSIAFGSTNIILAHTTAGTNVLDMANISNFSITGTGQFTSAMGVTRTFTTGTLGSVTGSLALNGTNQYVSISHGQGGTGWAGTLSLLTTFTVESWINLATTPSVGATIASIWQAGGNNTLAWALYVDSSRQLAVQWGSEASTSTLNGGTIPLNTWTHVAWVGSGTNHFLYVNGILVATAGSAFNHSDPSAAFTVGVRLVNAGGAQQYFSGNISNLRVVNGIQVYTGNFTPSVSPLYPTQSSGTNISAIPAGYTELLLNTPNNASFLSDGGTNNFTLTNNGAAVAAATSPITSLPAAGAPPSLALTSGAAVPTFTLGSYFTNLNFTGTTCVPAASSITINGDLTLATGGTYTSLGVTMAGTGTITPLAKTIAAFIVNTTGTTTLAAAFGCTTFTMTAGTLNLAGFNLTDTGTATYTSGTLSNVGTITCTTWTTQGTFSHTNGTITPSVSFVLASGSYTQSGTSVLSAVPTFTHTAGSVTFRSTYSLTATGTYTLTAGTLTLGGDLTTGIFSSTNTNTRSIAFSTFNIVLAHTTAAQVVLGMDTLTGFSWTGTGGFTSAMTVTRTFQSGTTAGATSSNVPNLSLTSGVSIPTISSGGYFKNLNFTGSTCAPASTSINIYGNLTLASGGTYSTFTAIMVGAAGNVNGGGSASLLGLNINNNGGSTTLTAALTLLGTGVTTLTSGNLNLGGFTLTTGTFVSSSTNVRSITFGTANIILATTTAAAVNVSMADATNFTYTSSGTYGSGTGCFQATMSATRTFQFGTSAGGSATNAPRLYLASGASVATITTGGWWSEIDFGTTAYTTAATNLNLISLKSNLSTSVLTLLTATMVGSGSIRTNTTIGPLVVNTSGITTTLAGTTLCTTAVLTLGTLDLATQILTCSSTFTWNGGSLLNFGTLSCTTFTLNGPTLNLTSGTLNPSTSFVLNTGSFTYSAPATLGPTTTFTQNAGTVTFNKTYALNAVSTYTFVLGTLTLTDGVTLSTGIFSSNNTNTRSIVFGSATAGNINLTHTTAATVVLAMGDLTGYSYTGPGGFTVTDMGNTRTITYGTTNGTATTTNNLTFTTGASAITITNGSSFNTLNFGTTTSTCTGTNVNIFGSLLLNGTYTAMSFNMFGTGNLNGGASASLLALVINTTGTITMTGNFTSLLTGTVTLTRGSLVLNGFTLTTGRFISDGTGFTRSVDFGSTYIVLAHSTAGNIVLTMGDITGFTWTGTTGGFSSSMGVTRTFQYGSTAGGSTSKAVNLLINGGAAIPTITTGGWYKNLDFTGNTSVPAATALNITGNLILATGGTYTSLSVTMLDTSTITPNGKTIAAFVVNTSNTITLAAAFGSTTYTQTAGTMNFATFNMTCSSTVTYTGGTLSNIGTLACTTFTLNGPTFTFSSGTINPSAGFVVTAGSFTYNSPAVLGATPLFTQTAGNVALNQAYSLTATGTYTLTSGALSLGGNLTTGIFNTNSQLLRSIAFSTYNIVLAHTTAAQTVLNMPDIVNFSYTGTGGFTTAMSVTRTFTSGTQMGIPGSMAFNGTTSNLLYATNVGFAYSTNIDFTWELWVYTSSSATGGAVFNNQNSAADTSGVTAFVVGGQAYWFNLGLNSGLGANFGTTSAGSIPNNTWTHVAFQRRGTDFEIYINGTLASSYTPVSPINTGATSQRLYIGRDTINGNNFAGQITNVRVVDGTAVYTGTFTVPTIPLAAAQTSGTNITALDGFTTYLMLNAVRGIPLTDSSINALSPTNTSVVTNAASPFPDAYYGQYPNLTITSGASVPTFTASSLFNTLDFTTSTCAPSGTVSINNLTLSTAPVYTGLNVICVGTGSIIQNNKTLGSFEVKNGYVGGTVTIITNPLAAGNYTQTSGTIDFSSTSLTISGVYTYVAGTQLNLISIIGGTLVVTGTYNFTSGTISPSTITVISPGAFTYGGTATISSGSVTTFTQTSGSVILNKNLTLAATGTYTLTSGSLTLGDGTTLTTGIFASNNSNVRSIAFGNITPANIVLAHTTAAQTVVNMPDLTNFSWTGPGGFVSGMSVTRSFNIGSTIGSTSTALNLAINSGASVPTISSGSWINNLNFTGSTCTPAGTSLNIGANLTLASGGTYSNVDIITRGTGTITPNGKILQAFTVNNGSGTTTLAGALTVSTYVQTAGTIDFATFNLTCATTGLFTAGTLNNVGSITCTTFTVAGTFSHTNGTITPSVSFVTTSGSYTQSGTSVLSSVATFTQTAGNVTFRSTYALTATGTYTLTAGTLTLGGNLTTGIFSSTGTGVRSIAFGSYNVVLAHTTAGTTVLSMAILTNFTPTGTGGFAADASITRTFTSGTTNGSATSSPNLSLTGSGTAIATFTTGSWFNTLDFGTTAFAIAVTALNLNGLTLSSSGTYTNLTPTARGTGTFTSNGNSLSTLIINAPSGTVTTADALTITNALTLAAGTLVAPYNITSATFLNTGPYSKTITGSTTTYTVTGAGATAWNFASSGSASFNGTTQRLSSPTNAAFTFGTGDLTLECWIYQTATSAGAYKVIFADNVYGGTGGYTLYSYNNALNLWIGGSPQVEIIAPAGTIALNTWTHVAWSRSGSSNRLFIDGTQVGATTTDSTNYTGTASLIGASTLSTLFFPGYMTNIRIVKGVAVYTGNFTVPTSPLLPTQSSGTNISAITGTQTSLLLLPYSDSTTTDYSTNAFTITNTGGVTANTLSPFAVNLPGQITTTNLTISMTSASAKTFAGRNGNYSILNQGGAGALTIIGDNSFTDITATTRPSTITFTAGSTQTFTNFTLSGTLGNLVTINSTSPGTQFNLSRASGTTSVGYLNIQDSNATGGAYWYADITSFNVGNNTGWIFTAPPGGVYLGNFFAFF
jgi:hypothetical protein